MPKKTNMTIKERIVLTAKDFEIPADKISRFLSSIMELIERAKSPDLFCEKCDERMSIDLESATLQCFNCGFEKKIEMHPYTGDVPVKYDNSPSGKDRVEVKPNTSKPNTAILKAIDKLEGTGEAKPGKKSSILELANSRGGAKVNEEDEKFIKSAVPGVKDINWS